MKKVTKEKTDARKIENKLNKIGFTFGYCKYTNLITIDNPILKKAFYLGHYQNENEMMEEIEKWLKSDSNPFKFYFNDWTFNEK